MLNKRIREAISKLPPKTSDTFTWDIKHTLGLKMEMEYKFHPDRKWRFDYAIPEYKIAIEVEGGVWKKTTYTDKDGKELTIQGGRHTTGKGYINDLEKYNTATAMGWAVFRVTPSQIKKYAVPQLIRDCIFNRNKH